MLSVEQALGRILASVRPLPRRNLDILACQGLVLAGPVRARVPLPSFHNSAVDGYALARASVRGIRRDAPVRLPILERIWAGGWPRRKIRPGRCSQIATGAPLPAGADTVVMKERVALSADGRSVLLREPPGRGENVRRRGEDVKPGSVVLSKGTVLRPMDLMLAAQTGNFSLPVFPRPRVAVLSTGDELQDPSPRLSPGKIFDGNRAGLAGLVRWAGGDIATIARARDNIASLRKALGQALERADVVLTSGGVSVGEKDYLRRVLKAMGARERLWRIAVKPGKPLALFTRGRKVVFCLPGNPVSAFATFLLFVKPVLDKLSGRPLADLFSREARLARATPRSDRRQFLRGLLERRSGEWRVRPAGGQGSHMLGSLVRADCLYEIPEGKGTLAAGTPVRVFPFTF